MFSPGVVITPPQNGKRNPSQILPGVRTPPPQYGKNDSNSRGKTHIHAEVTISKL